MGKRHRPDIHAAVRTQSEMFILCPGEGCSKARYRNAVAVWTRQLICSRCRGRKVVKR